MSQPKRKKVNEIGLFEKIFPKTAVNQATENYFQTLTAYQPRFTTFQGGIYEALMCRSAVHTFANHCSKLKIEVTGSNDRLKGVLGNKPNPWMTTSQFLYRLATILEVDTTAFIVPIMDYEGKKIMGFYPVKPADAVIKEYRGKEYFVFTFPTGKRAAVEADFVGVLTKFQYKDDFFGSGNGPLYPTIKMMDTQDQGVIEGIKSNASIRFMAILSGVFKDKTIEEARASFAKYNLQNNNTGVMMFDEKFRDVKQIDSKPLVVDDRQLQQIKNNIYTYFGANEKILMNNFGEDEWNAYYEGKIEPFAIQVSEVMTSMLYSDRELAFGNKIILSSNRLEYASNKTKLDVVTQLFDRGMMTQNQGLEVFNMPPVENGNKFYIRKEYAEVNKLNEAQGLTGGEDDANKDGEGVSGNADTDES
jgi:hypothetical protein